jgi:hypothetical protein
LRGGSIITTSIITIAVTGGSYLPVKAADSGVLQRATRISSALFVMMISVFVVGCATVSEEDLVDLQSPNAIVKQEAIQRISQEQSFPASLMYDLASNENEKNAIAIMVESLRRGRESKDVQLNILTALGELSKRTQVPVSPLIEKLKDEDPDIRTQAIEALARTQSKEASTALVKLLEEDAHKYAIIWAIGEIGDKGAIPTLNRLLASEDKYVRHNASRALAKMGSDQEEIDSSSDNSGIFDLGRNAFKKYQGMMIAVFRKIRDIKGAQTARAEAFANLKTPSSIGSKSP